MGTCKFLCLQSSQNSPHRCQFLRKKWPWTVVSNAPARMVKVYTCQRNRAGRCDSYCTITLAAPRVLPVPVLAQLQPAALPFPPLLLILLLLLLPPPLTLPSRILIPLLTPIPPPLRIPPINYTSVPRSSVPTYGPTQLQEDGFQGYEHHCPRRPQVL